MDLTNYETLRVEDVGAETDKAWQLTINGHTEWWPKSQCRLEGWNLYAPKWLLKKRQGEEGGE